MLKQQGCRVIFRNRSAGFLKFLILFYQFVAPKTPPNYYAESQRLVRSKTEDYLKKKILQRPDRQTLIQYHILEEANVSPALANNQKNLQRAQLADQLNMKISVRPGPIELIQRNILEAEDGIKERF